MNKRLQILKQLNKEHSSCDKGFHGYWEPYSEYLPETCRSMLELGVAKGDSAMIWFKLFGRNLDLHLLDLFENPDFVSVRWCKERFYEPHQGSESDVEFLSSIKTKFQVIVNDCSHNVFDQIVSFKHLWTNNLKSKGLFVVEDLHTNVEPFYWNEKISGFEDSLLWTFKDFAKTGLMRSKFFSDDSGHFEDTIEKVEVVNDKIAFIWKR